MTNPSSIETVVMQRVARIAFFRPLISRTAFSAVAGTAALWGIGREVWVARVFENAPHTLASVPEFYLSAFSHTEFMVQALTIVTLIALFSLAERVTRGMGTLVLPQRT